MDSGTEQGLNRAARMFLRILPMVFAAGWFAPGTARAWWNDEWTGRKQFWVDTSAAGANVTDPIGSSAVLVRLHSGNFKLEAVKDDGSDLRFIAADDKTPLKFHLEKFDPLLGEALAWVAIPDLKPGTKTAFWVYFGNAKATVSEDMKGTFDPATSLVYHFTERDQPARDSSSWGNQAVTAGKAAEGAIIGRGLKLDGTLPITLPGGPSLAWTAGGQMTWSIWLKPAEVNESGILFSRSEGTSSFRIGLDLGKPYAEVSEAGIPKRATATSVLAANSWHHLAVSVGAQGLVVHVDGVAEGKVPAGLPALAGTSFLGGEGEVKAVSPNPAVPAKPAKKGAKPEVDTVQPAPALPFKGEVDELQIAKVERPQGFLRFAAIDQGTDPGKLLVAGQEEEGSSWASGYFAIIIKSVTLDGWVVIGILVLMSLVSWMVMAGKSSYLGRVERANKRFLKSFRESSGELARAVDEVKKLKPAEAKVFRESPLYRIFQGGAEEIRKRSDGTRPLHAESIEAIRATLDAGLVRENQRLNSSMVLLTIAISGGPFLGLLGTVVGVMITFASIAAAGDVNVNAIAPGIAAALVATVAGLAVAIPALFGYNWLLTRAKNTYATMQVFVDELVTRIAEAYSERVIAEQTKPHLASVDVD